MIGIRLSLILLAGFFLWCPLPVEAATSAIDNLPGGAGIAYWQAGGGWETLMNVQTDGYNCALVHVGIYDGNGLNLTSFVMSLDEADNFGIIVRGDSTNIQLYDYSDNAFGGSTALNDVATGPPVEFYSPAGTDGIQRGYMTFVKSNTGCSGPGGSPSGNITGTFAVSSDTLWVRAALISPHNAFAVNAAMLQGFANYGALRESRDFVNTVAAPNTPPGTCDFNGDGDVTDSFAILDDTNGPEIDFAELFLSDNVSSVDPLNFPPWIICNPGDLVHKALGSPNNAYCTRFNNNPTVGTQTTLVLVAPQSSHASAANFSKQVSLMAYNDDSFAISTIFSAGVVTAKPFGSTAGEIPVGSFTAGEACFTVELPVFGFSFTETASFADLYPFVRIQVAVTTLNKDGIDDAVDVIYLP
ncbi:MAG: hypothetical protein RDU01_11760 [Thermodesulfovibrionales bacterium]|nr:hypothetical protein [Thermodesulfovibrionales bacterium]